VDAGLAANRQERLNRLTNGGREMNNWSSTRRVRLMKRLTRAALALSEGAASLVLVGLFVLGVVVVVVLLFAAIAPPSTSATPAPPAQAAAAPGGTGVHLAGLTGWISGADC
jgi:hypothetical protein